MNILHRAKRAVVLVLVFIVAVANLAIAQKNKTKPQAQKTKLVLLVVIDQFRYDYLERFKDLFVANGFNRLLRNGASWTNCNYDHTPTYTAPGHATLMTGAYPNETGIVGNEWNDRESGMFVSNSSDPEDTIEKARWQILGGGEKERGSGPRRLKASTIGDELRMATDGRSRVIGISLKDRAAIMPAGRNANAAFWFSAQTGNVVSSEYYFRDKLLPDWVVKFNTEHAIDKYAGTSWNRLLADESLYVKYAGIDAATWEGNDNTFPHILPNRDKLKDLYDRIEDTPFSNEILFRFAKEAITNEKLGQGDETDVLTLSFSANDYVGHRYGPYSQEVMDVTLRTDRLFAELFDFVDKKIGLQNTIVIFTADHGVAPNPEQANEVFNLDGNRIRNADIMKVVRDELTKHYGTNAADYIQKFKNLNGTERDGISNGQIYFNMDALKRDKVSLDEAVWVAGDAVLKNIKGISRYFTREQLLNKAVSPNDDIARRVLHGFYPKRSGDLILVYDAFKYLDSVSKATHGSPYSYDTHVPLIFMGRGIRAGVYNSASSPADIAPTLATLLKLQLPSNSVGRILGEGLK
jgi:predicted AlkP superfamily pyrophosphatase or phosphodiesterase